ncbi:XdhC family protein [Flavobacterium sp. 123]|jgi:xanthine/CO dehydrogenase XdhC/CoxF family maturation factor|uniref:XdhC family protein n=1 Tax=Flavobacterium sp. 123 TaxID=2135627 RepID=UPI000EAF43CA|nr:XdhC/CoxI family protein [Flavobacterium sp. 123]RKT00237.1 xanthine/CO dehydrogenase XdhC/CoxF family maturation factor [Flavobacterium sp. 123]
MKELQDIIKKHEKANENNLKSALVTVVHLDGSSYRRPGARMLVNEDGKITGAISGGCLEGDAQKKALFTISEQKNVLFTYDTSKEDDSEMGIHLGCEGLIQVLFEKIDSEKKDNPIELLRIALSLRQKAVLVTLFHLDNKEKEQLGTCLLLQEDGTISGNIPLSLFKNSILGDLNEVMNNEESVFKQYKSGQESVTAFFEFIHPPVSLVVLGAGNDAIPLMKFADVLGWDFRIVDRRDTHANKERFPLASQTLVANPDVALNYLSYDKRTFFVLVTHSYKCDYYFLKSLCAADVPYVGILGPKKKLNRMLGELKEGGVSLSQAKISTIFSPTGLDIGAETPEEIALSIIAEIQAVLKGKKGGMLTLKEEVIHSRDSLAIQVELVKN